MPTGDTRDAVISLPIPGRAVIERFEAVERLSEPFVISVLVLCDDDVDFFPHLGAPVAITVSHEGERVRAFHGLLFSADYVDQTGAGHRYHLTLRPWLHVLSRNLDYSIFQDKSAVEIIKSVFELRNRGDVDYKLNRSYTQRDYCVQYRESDFAFVSRLMEEEGIYYFFRHDEDRHVMVLCDGRGSHQEADYSSLPFISPTGGTHHHSETRLRSDRVWLWNERIGSGAEHEVNLKDFDFEHPDTDLTGVAHGSGDPLDSEKAQIYDFPGGFTKSEDGESRAKVIIEAAHRRRRSYVGEGDATALFCGALVKLARHPVDRLNQDYLVTDLRYGLEAQTYRSGAAPEVAPALISLEAVPADTPWRAPFATPKPVARGPETAIVTGPPGEVIYTDKYGRVKVRFHWDRSGSAGEKSTCFIRVSHNSAGSAFGNVILPRLGQEVIVDFLDGDPDRPIVTGRIYNANEMPPYTLPDQNSKSVWRSETIGKTGSYDGSESPPSGQAFNEISMDDTGGKEQLFIRAQRDATTMVYHDDTRTVQRDQTARIGRDRKTNIKNNETLTVEQGDVKYDVSTGKRVTTIQQNEELTVSQGDVKTTVSMGNMTTGVSMGNYSLKTAAGSVSVEAMQKIELKVGGNSIVIDPSGVTIKGIMVSITAQAILQAKGAMTDVEGSGMTTIKGGIVMIN